MEMTIKLISILFLFAYVPETGNSVLYILRPRPPTLTNIVEWGLDTGKVNSKGRNVVLS